MNFKLYKNVNEFYNDTYDILMQRESQNVIPLGNIILGKKGKDKTEWRDPDKWFMAAVRDENGIQLTALMTPPHNITLYATDNVIKPQAVKCLINELKNIDIPGVMSEKNLAECFAEEYILLKGLTFNIGMKQRIYELTTVNPEIKQFGDIRLMDEKDMNYFPYWAEAFNAANIYGKKEMFIPQDEKLYNYRLSTKKHYVLEDNGVPVSMAGFSKETGTIICVSFVYTPPYNRGKGYASSCVAKISQIALDKGFSKCVLYTDLINPTSNKIYQNIGYKPVCDSLILQFIV